MLDAWGRRYFQLTFNCIFGYKESSASFAGLYFNGTGVKVGFPEVITFYRKPNFSDSAARYWYALSANGTLSAAKTERKL